jgi:hypothetical protein
VVAGFTAGSGLLKKEENKKTDVDAIADTARERGRYVMTDASGSLAAQHIRARWMLTFGRVQQIP